MNQHISLMVLHLLEVLYRSDLTSKVMEPLPRQALNTHRIKDMVAYLKLELTEVVLQ